MNDRQGMRSIGGIFLLVTVSFSLHGQQNLVLQNNPSLKWYQINTPHFKIIYPKGFDTQANRVANTLEHIREPEANTMGDLPAKISVVLQNQSSVSNAFVSITPRRSEFYTMPTQNYNMLGNNDWINLIASHEYRHIVQFQHARRGLNKLIYYTFGNNGLSLMAYLAAPQWFWEGDAVVTETAFTPGGRGRIPNFDLIFKTNLLEGREFNYHKQYLRSYKHFIPDHYVLGYHMVSYLRRKTQRADVWEDVTARSWSMPFAPFTFSNSLKKVAGFHVTGLYKEMARSLQEQWRAQLDTLTFTQTTPVNARTSEAYTDYRFPLEVEDGAILTMKSGIGDIEKFVLLHDKGEKKIFTPGPINQTGMLSYGNHRFVWNEYRYDPRWRVHTYSVLMGYDLATRRSHQITANSRYAGAAISPDGTKVATVETDSEYKTSLVVVDYITGEQLKKYDNPDNSYISMPHWSESGDAIIALTTNQKGKSLVSVDYSSGKTDLIDFFGDENIGYPVPFKNLILYNSPLSGIDNIYAFDRNTGNRFQITSSRLGAYNPHVSRDGKYIYYNEQGRDGLDVVRTEWQPASWKQVPDAAKQPGVFFQSLVEQEGRPTLLDSVPTHTWDSKKYSQVRSMFNIYSWGPYLYNDLAQLNIGITSQDVLSTTSLNAGYIYDLNEHTGSWRAGISYQKFFPIIDFQVASSARKSDEGVLTYYTVSGTDTTWHKDNLTFRWDEKTIESGLRIPLLTTSSRYYGSVSVSNYLGYSYITNFENSIDGGGRILPSANPQYIFREYADQGTLLYNRFGITAYRLLKQSRRDIYSKWGQALFVNAYNTPYGGDYSGSLFSFQGRAFFPGLFKHHSLWGYWAYQRSEIADVSVSTKQGLDNYLFRNTIPLPRGHSVGRFEDFYSMSANYTMPVWYPDISVGPLLNVQRVRANFFFDYGFGQSTVNQRSSQKEYVSVGSEVMFDVNFFRLLPQYSLGVRYSYGITPAVTKFEVVLGSLNF